MANEREASATDRLYDLVMELLQEGTKYRDLMDTLKEAHADWMNEKVPPTTLFGLSPKEPA